MATRTPLYLDFAEGHVKEIAATDLLAFNVTGLTGNYAGHAGKYVRVAPAADVLEFATIAGGGDVVGPASAVDSRIVLFDGATGKLIKDGGVLLSAKQDTLVSGTNIKTVNGSSVLGSGNLSLITQVEVDFGTTPLYEQTFSIANSLAAVGSKIIANIAYDAPTDKDLDEIEMDDLVIKCGNATTGFFDMLIRSVDGSYLADKFKINYIIA